MDFTLLKRCLKQFLTAKVLTESTNDLCFQETEKIVEEYFNIDLSGYASDNVWRIYSTNQDWAQVDNQPDSMGNFKKTGDTTEINIHEKQGSSIEDSLIHEFIHALFSKTVSWANNNCLDSEVWVFLFADDIAKANDITIKQPNAALSLTSQNNTDVGWAAKQILDALRMNLQEFGQLLISNQNELEDRVYKAFQTNMTIDTYKGIVQKNGFLDLCAQWVKN